MRKRPLLRSAREGFTLVEIVLAMIILSIVLASLAGLTYQTARRSLTAQGMDYQQALLMQQSNFLSAVPFDSLGNYTGCTTVSTQPLPHTRCITLSNISSTVRRMTIVITPALAKNWKADTTMIDRSKPATTPFN